MNVFKSGFDIITNNRLVKNLFGDNGSCSTSNELKERLTYFINLAIIYMINLYKLSYGFILNLVNMVFARMLAQERVLNKEIVLITGSGGYLGRNLALEFAKKNATLVLWDMNEEENKKTLEQLHLIDFHDVHIYTVDLSNKKELDNVANKVKNDVGPIYLVVMAAAPRFNAKSVMDTNYDEDIKKQFYVNYLSQLWTIQAFLPDMIKSNNGHFVTISSITAILDFPLISSYASFKTAQAKLMETLREELVQNNITGVKTSVVYMTVLKGGLAKGWEDIYSYSDDVILDGHKASRIITSSILKNKQIIYVPNLNCVYNGIKLMLPHDLTRMIRDKKAKLNPKYLQLDKNKSTLNE